MSQGAAYWNENAEAFVFTHPLDPAWLSDLPKAARILDYGCGYGRTLAELADAGWRNAVGADVSAAMIERGRREHPDLDLRTLAEPSLDEPDGAFDAALLFAVLTGIADEAAQGAVMAELRRLVRPGGLLYLSDYPLQSDPRYLARYEAGEAMGWPRGVWRREDGGFFRHQTPEGLAWLLGGFTRIAEREVRTVTMSGAPARAIQILARRD